uniref:Uncharacterized protein n=1 Tax=Tanacetum cinerariifolium TaxID=118510 RepID=A0A6L2KL69_TANCI|nr:hypothetical protein [Tanacetum cinerariifolium]
MTWKVLVQPLLRGRSMRNERFVQDKKSTSVAASELGLLSQTHTISDLSMKYHQENSQELADDSIDETEAISVRNNIGESHRVDSLTNMHGNPQEYDVSVQEKHRVLDYKTTQQLPPTNIVESSDHPLPSPENNEDKLSSHDGSVEAEELEEPTILINEGLDANSIENEDGCNRLELRERMSRRKASNLLQSGFSLRLDQLLQSYVERQEQASQFDDEWILEHEQQDPEHQSVDENDDVSDVGQSAGVHSSPPTIPQHSRTECEIINGLRIEEQMNSRWSTLETCMKRQHELRRSIEQEVLLALNLVTLGKMVVWLFQFLPLLCSIEPNNKSWELPSWQPLQFSFGSWNDLN